MDASKKREEQKARLQQKTTPPPAEEPQQSFGQLRLRNDVAEMRWPQHAIEKAEQLAWTIVVGWSDAQRVQREEFLEGMCRAITDYCRNRFIEPATATLPQASINKQPTSLLEVNAARVLEERVLSRLLPEDVRGRAIVEAVVQKLREGVLTTSAAEKVMDNLPFDWRSMMALTPPSPPRPPPTSMPPEIPKSRSLMDKILGKRR